MARQIFSLNKKTGEVKQIGEANDQPDRILKTDKDGNVKKKGEGFLVSEKKRGEAKVEIGGIEQGFLKDGMNLQSPAVSRVFPEELKDYEGLWPGY